MKIILYQSELGRFHMPRDSKRKKHTLIRRPRLERRTVSGNGSKVAIVQPIQHLILLFDPGIPLPIINPYLMMPSCQLIPFLRQHAIVRFDEPASDEQYITNLYVPTLRLRSDIDFLIPSASLELRVRDAIRFVRVQRDALLIRVGAVIEEDAATCDAVVRPVVDRAFVVRVGTDNVGAMGVVVEGLCGHPGKLRSFSRFEIRGRVKHRRV